jgi:hypothetical protein
MTGPCTCCESPNCRDRRCSIAIPSSAVGCTCWSGTALQNTHEIIGAVCDCLIAWARHTGNVVCAAELKGGHIDAVKCVEQLRGGARLLEVFCPDANAVDFFPVVAHRGIASVEITRLRRARVRFRGQSVEVVVVRCGSRLVDIVARYGPA